MPTVEWLAGATTSILVDGAIKTTVLLALALLAVRLMRSRSAAFRHLIACAGLAAVLVLPLLVWMLPRLPLAILPADTSPSAPAGPQAQLTVPIANTPAPPPLRETRSERHQPTRDLDLPAAPSQVRALQSEMTLASVESTATTSSSHAAPRIPWTTAVAVLWTLGLLLTSLRLLRSRLRLRRLLRSSEPISDRAWQLLLEDSAARLGNLRKVLLFRSAALDVPVTFGALLPCIILPAHADEWTRSRRAAVLGHELAHVRRMDALTQWLADLTCIFYWFHPLVWMSAHAMRAERERACDDAVLQAGARPSEYARDLLEIASALKPEPEYAAALAMARRSQLEGRLMSVLTPNINRSSVTRAAAAAVAVVALALLVPIAAVSAQSRKPEPPKSKVKNQVADRADMNGGVAGGVKDGVAGGVEGGVEAGIQGGVEGGIEGERTVRPEPVPLPGPAGDVEPDPRPAIAIGVGEGEGRGEGEGAGYAYSYSTDSGEPAIAAVTATGKPAVFVQSGTDDSGDGPWPAECKTGDSTSRSTSRSHSNGRRSWNAMWSNSACTVELKAEGEIKFAPDLSGIQSISQGGWLEVLVRVGDSVKRVRATPGPGGQLQYAYTVDGKPLEFDAEARKLFASFLLTIERYTGFAAEARVPYLLKQGGPNAVLDEAAKLGGDYVRSLYYIRLLEAARLDPAQVQRVIQQSGHDIHSDYELARVLMAVSGKYPLDDEASRMAFLESAGTLKSDYEHARVLIELLKRENLSREAARMALTSAARIRNDYERARTLMAIASANLLDISMQPEYMKALAGIRSDYEQARVLLDLMSRQKLTPDSARIALQSTASLNSDYEKARVLIALADGGLVSEPMVPGYLEALSAIKSAHERSRVLIAAINKLPLKNGSVVALIEAASGINGDHERSRVLVALAGKYPLSGEARSAYVKAASGIRGEYERKRALEAVGSSMM